jgi:TonB-dependent SusC/RagA subfamily outer membrane receptor
MTWKPRMRLTRVIGTGALAVTFAVLACETPAAPVVETGVPDAQLVAEGADTSFVFVGETVGDDEEPLFVVDGVIVARGMIDLDAVNIESIEVIKGEAVKQLYGDRAANGVVTITTKKRGAEETGKLQPIGERR